VTAAVVEATAAVKFGIRGERSQAFDGRSEAQFIAGLDRWARSSERMTNVIRAEAWA